MGSLSTSQKNALLETLMSQNQKSRRGGLVSRVLQLDAMALDTELETALLQRFTDAILAVAPASSLDSLRPEVEAFLKAALFTLSIGHAGTTPGLTMMNLRLRDERSVPPNYPVAGAAFPLAPRQKVLLGFIKIILPYIMTRLQLHATYHGWSTRDQTSWQHRLWRILNRAEVAHLALSLLNLLLFLRDGRWRSVAERLAQTRVVYARPQINRLVSYDQLNQQLLWFTLTDVVQAVAPLLQLRRLQQTLRRYVKQAMGSAPSDAVAASPDASTCPKCASPRPVMPHRGNGCSCVYCYVCLRGLLDGANGRGITCYDCGEVSSSMAWCVPS